jgi:hypothetical protein
MSDISPAPTLSPAKAKEQKQLKMLAVLGAILVLVLIFMVLKPFSGGDDTSAPPAPAVTADATAPVAGATAAPGATAETTAPAPPPARPGRSPCDPPR